MHLRRIVATIERPRVIPISSETVAVMRQEKPARNTAKSTMTSEVWKIKTQVLKYPFDTSTRCNDSVGVYSCLQASAEGK